MRILSLFFYLLVISPSVVLADTETRTSAWFMSLSRFNLSEKVPGFLDIQPRFTLSDIPGGDNSALDTLLLRGAIGYQLQENIALYQGYGYIPTYDPNRDEHRSFQELFIKQPFSDGLALAHRFRLEQRFLKGIDDVAYRFRYFGRLTKKLPFINENLSLAINEEVFINLNDADGGPQSGFNQNRLFLGLNYRINSQLALEVGYQNQFINGRRGADDVMNHITFFGVQTKF